MVDILSTSGNVDLFSPEMDSMRHKDPDPGLDLLGALLAVSGETAGPAGPAGLTSREAIIFILQQGTDQIVVKRKGSIVAERKFSIYQYNSKVSVICSLLCFDILELIKSQSANCRMISK